MSDATLTAFQKDLETVKRDLDRFVELYQDVRYRYYHAKPPVPVPHEVWDHIADNHENVAYDKLDCFPDRTACLSWDEETFDVKKFNLLCQQCCKILWKHANLLASVAEIHTVVGMPLGYHQWIRLIHEIAGSKPVWSGLVNKCLVVSQRPFDETRKEREIEWMREPIPTDIEVVVVPIEPDELEEQLVRKLLEQGVSVPDVWFEYIPRPVAKFHRQMLDVLEELVQCSCPYQEELHARSAPQQPVRSETAGTNDSGVKTRRLVTLREVAPLVGRAKRTLRRYKEAMPPPAAPGGEGKKDCWDWRELRPWLEKKFGMKLPERFPDQGSPHNS